VHICAGDDTGRQRLVPCKQAPVHLGDSECSSELRIVLVNAGRIGRIGHVSVCRRRAVVGQSLAGLIVSHGWDGKRTMRSVPVVEIDGESMAFDDDPVRVKASVSESSFSPES